MRARRHRRPMPLWVLAGGGTLVAGLVFIGSMALGLVVEHQLRSRVTMFALVPGAAAAVVFAVVAALAAHRTAAALREVRLSALQEATPTRMGAAPALGRSHRRFLPSLRGSAELSELTGLIEMLRLRVRLADEVALRHQRSAETASAGMFELLSGLVAAEESARGQLAAELHDTVAQSLAQAKRLLEDVRPETARDRLLEAEDQVRAVMARTRPPALRHGDLAQAVVGLRDDFAQRYGLAVNLNWPRQVRPLPLATAVTVYRFFQEALLNVVKHCEDLTVDAALDFDGGNLRATVRDHGPGFDPAAVRPDRGRHVGLGLLAERARLAGGRLEVDSRPGSATTLRLRLPAAPGVPAENTAKRSPVASARSRPGRRVVA